MSAAREVKKKRINVSNFKVYNPLRAPARRPADSDRIFCEPQVQLSGKNHRLLELLYFEGLEIIKY